MAFVIAYFRTRKQVVEVCSDSGERIVAFASEGIEKSFQIIHLTEKLF